MYFSEQIEALARKAEQALASRFAQIDRISFLNTQKVMDAFREHRVNETLFNPTSGYGYNDRGREVLDEIWADVMGAEAVLILH